LFWVVYDATVLEWFEIISKEKARFFVFCTNKNHKKIAPKITNKKHTLINIFTFGWAPCTGGATFYWMQQIPGILRPPFSCAKNRSIQNDSKSLENTSNSFKIHLKLHFGVFYDYVVSFWQCMSAAKGINFTILWPIFNNLTHKSAKMSIRFG